ncbi:hypothetical protein F53441_14719 [Fusarium austroafricanum]|uniref:Carboxylesterase type B domain-containing protein n=1 Tax=Fusarium austroafricanum TaxID=2364996 RepID=A0A8H4NH79_9HYPO|nr:hypothetical protein F53441_14719 [Fusarium austroafricanum]
MDPRSHLLLLTTLMLFAFVNSVAPIVDVSYNEYKGKDLGNSVTQWLGIRYAAPPVGDLRFMPPQDPVRSRQSKDASKFKLKCVVHSTQAQVIGKSRSEDCLFLNVFAPKDAPRKAKLLVFIDIQGGGFNANSRYMINGSNLIQASGLKVVIVTLNYRVLPSRPEKSPRVGTEIYFQI